MINDLGDGFSILNNSDGTSATIQDFGNMTSVFSSDGGVSTVWSFE